MHLSAATKPEAVSISVLRSNERGQSNTYWLESYHSFSFGEYFNPQWQGFGPLLVVNEDYVRPNSGFAMHGHKEMEIVTVVLEGTLEHKDSTGGQGLIRAGEVQRMTAGTGIRHSESNPSSEDTVHLLQIWIKPNQNGLEPGYVQGPSGIQKGELFAQADRGAATLQRLIAPITESNLPEGVLGIHQNASLLLGKSHKADELLIHNLGQNRRLWVQIISGSWQVAGTELKAGDAVGLLAEQTSDINLLAQTAGAQVLLIDLPKD